MRWEGERLGLSAGLKGEHTIGAGVPFAAPAPLQKNSGAILPSAFTNWEPLVCLPTAATQTAVECWCWNRLKDLSSDVTVFTGLYPTWGCLHLGFHHTQDGGLLLLSTRRAAASPHRGGGWCHSGAEAQLRCGNLWRAQQEQPLGALTLPGTEASAGLVPLLLDLFWPHAVSPSLQTLPMSACSCQ